MKFLLIFFIFVLGVEAQTKHHSVVKKRVITGGAPVAISDDFSTDPASRWTADVGTYTWQSGTEDLDITSNTGVTVNNTTLTGDDGYSLTKLDVNLFGGLMFRYNGTVGYVVRTNNNTTVVWRYCTGASCTDLESDAVATMTPPNWLGVRWSGTGDATVVECWIFQGGAPTDPTDPDTWDADGNLHHTVDFTANPGANARDTGTEVALYVGSANDITFDDFYAGD